MLPGFLLSLREGLEAALIIGIVLGALRKVGRPQMSRMVWAGAASAAALSLAVALVMQAFGAALEGAAEQLFEGIAMLLAAGILTWMIFWMQRQSRFVKSELESGVRRAVAQGGGAALFILAFTAVLREGIELALFLTATAVAIDRIETLAGALIGLLAAALLGWALFATTLHLNLRRFFQITGALLIVFAAGLVAHGVHEFNELGWIPSIIEHLYDVNPLLNERSIAGQMLVALFGYNGNPSLSETAAYLLYFAAIGVGLRLSAPPRSELQSAQP